MSDQTPPSPHSSSAPPPVPALPPTLPGDMYVPASWHTGLAIACFIIGGLGVFVAFFGAIGPWIQHAFAALDTTGTATTTINVQRRFLPWLILGNVVGLSLAIFLILIGFHILKRRQRAARLIPFYAAAKIAHALALIALTAVVQKQTFEALQSTMSPGITATFTSGIATFSQILGIIFAIIMYTTMPVLLLIWFARKSVKAEVARWS